MNAHQDTLGWIDLPQGRARFSGGVRGADEAGHDTFALELGGATYYGEIRRAYRANQNDFDLEIVSFGWPGTEWMGMPMPGARHRFDPDEIDVARAMIVQLVAAGTRLEQKPSFLVDYPDARFMGQVLFADDWILPAETVVGP